MISNLAFLSPWMLAGLAVLPILWLIMRMTPPRPVRQIFPPTRILLGLQAENTTPRRTPWWLTALRLLLAALIVVALAEPVLRPQENLAAPRQGPLLVLLDNGWDTAPDFETRREVAARLIDEAGRADRPVALAATAGEANADIAAGTAAEASRRLAAIEPHPYPADRGALRGRLAELFPAGSTEVAWIAGPLDGGDAAAFAETLARIDDDPLMIASSAALSVLRPPHNAADNAEITVSRVGPALDVTIAGFDSEGRRMVEMPASLSANGDTKVTVSLPTEMRNEIARFAIDGERSAGAVQLLDGRWRRKSVGLISGEGGGAAQPLLAPLTYVERALSPYTDIREASAETVPEAIDQLLDAGISVLVLTQTGNLPPETVERLKTWISAGGTLLRFASANIAASDPELLPVRLREGERSLGGSLSWDEPQPIGRLSPESPFRGIDIPQDVRIQRQILAEPGSLNEAETWAELRDGTPLITATERGGGRIILFHVTADPRWSNLPIAGAFVDMLRAVVDTSQAAVRLQSESRGTAATAAAQAASTRTAPWRPASMLDGYGRLRPPGPEASLVADIANSLPSAMTPPGLYERGGDVRALNAVDEETDLTPLRPASLAWGGRVGSLAPQRAEPLWPWLLAAAALLAALDAIAALALSGRLVPRRTVTAGLIVLAALVIATPHTASAQEVSADEALAGTLSTRLAYVVTGDDLVDETSRAGLRGLTEYLSTRTALEPGDPVGLDLASDELSFYALIYWPISAEAEPPDAAVMSKVDAYMKNGGTILFDTRDAGDPMPSSAVTATPETQALRRLLGEIDVPPLEPVPPDHVLTKAFYLLGQFPGRWDGSELWVEALSDQPTESGRPARGGDGVSPIMITGNDLAAAWAISADNQFLYPTVPADPRQRELAFRAGVNIVMYTLTGNYKADQVHIPALLERLGQ
ncbi:DUF4159 domain-containing protein [Afifella sp. IM 167]|uniref:DUF4159 domain-containing protein n=1 Tax=Afifella sp. IM 167 TaxID=2033586 RepID=UPI001CD0054E|nr:DUF4159 domain-containing protein [Afifella sp. IM 167]MBZ8134856.1 RNA-binding protein [Afifella sp. IM 167]